jgi:hypothetical protein
MKLPLTVHEDGAIDFAEVGRLRRAAVRTTALRVALAAALVATLTGIVLLARGAGSGRATVLPSGATTGCVALDMSASIYPSVYRRLTTTLRGIADANRPMCLVMFSNTAYELLPPGSPPSALRSFIRFFKPKPGTPSPWDEFRGGTRISRGLAVADEALQRAGVEHGSIVLVSDIHDSSSDLPALNVEADRLRHERVPVRIVPLFAVQTDREYFSELFGWSTLIDIHALRGLAHDRVRPLASSAPWGLLTLGVVLVLLLFANESWNTRLAPEAS